MTPLKRFASTFGQLSETFFDIMQIDSQIIIDFRLALQKDQTKKPDIGVRQLLSYDPRELQEYYMDCDRTNCCSNDYISQDHDLDANQTDHFLMEHKRLLEPRERDNGNDIEDDLLVLFSYHVHGFVLRSRKWGKYTATLKVLSSTKVQ